MLSKLTEQDNLRYHRQMIMDGWGKEGQLKLKGAEVFVAGAGGLGSPCSIYLAIAGVGKLRICDCDRIELSNLNRQILHPNNRVGEEKAVSARKTLSEINPDIEIKVYSDKIEEDSIERLVEGCDIILDCMDNFPTRYLLNSYAIKHKLPLVHASIWGLEGRFSFIHSPKTPCLRCIFPESPPKEVFPVAGVGPGILGSIQALETIKYIVGIGSNYSSRLLIFDGLNLDFKTIKLRRDPNCPDCGKLR